MSCDNKFHSLIIHCVEEVFLILCSKSFSHVIAPDPSVLKEEEKLLSSLSPRHTEFCTL